MNLGIFSGNLGRDPEMRQTNNDSVLSFSIGVKTGNRDTDQTMWVDCSMWGKRGQAVQPYLRKGSRVTVSGSLKLDTYQDKATGAPKTVLRLTVQELDLPPKSEGLPGRPAPARAAATADGFHNDADLDIPF
jgi:single-strand DNA-binding protein